MKKHVVAAQARLKLNHAVGTIGKVSMLLKDVNLAGVGQDQNDGDDDDDDDNEDGRGEYHQG